MRKRLIELLEQARDEAKRTIGSMNNGFGAWYADYLLANGVVVLSEIEEKLKEFYECYRQNFDSTNMYDIGYEDCFSALQDLISDITNSE